MLVFFVLLDHPQFSQCYGLAALTCRLDQQAVFRKPEPLKQAEFRVIAYCCVSDIVSRFVEF